MASSTATVAARQRRRSGVLKRLRHALIELIEIAGLMTILMLTIALGVSKLLEALGK